MRASTLAFSLLAGLSACGERGADNGNASVEIKGDAGSGKVAVKIPGIDAKVSVPEGLMAKSGFDIDGVKLYPGSSTTGFSVIAGNDKSNEPTVRLGFTSPAAAPVVRDWFTKAFAERRITVAQSGDALVGKTKDGNDFRISLKDGTAGQTLGELTVDDGK